MYFIKAYANVKDTSHYIFWYLFQKNKEIFLKFYELFDFNPNLKLQLFKDERILIITNVSEVISYILGEMSECNSYQEDVVNMSEIKELSHEEIVNIYIDFITTFSAEKRHEFYLPITNYFEFASIGECTKLINTIDKDCWKLCFGMTNSTTFLEFYYHKFQPTIDDIKNNFNITLDADEQFSKESIQFAIKKYPEMENILLLTFINYNDIEYNNLIMVTDNLTPQKMIELIDLIKN